MKVEDGFVRQIKITEVEGLDPVRVMIEEYDIGQAKVIIECYGESWSSFWGSMGGDITDFFTRVNVPYLVNCFDRGIRSTTDEIDTSAMKETFIKNIKRKVVEDRKDWSIAADSARVVYDECERLADNLMRIAPEHPYDYWDFSKDYSICEHSWSDVFYDKEYFNEWMDNYCPVKYCVNWDYDYLSRIVTVVKEVVSEVSK